MNGICLEFYFDEFKKHNEILLYEWLLEWAKKNNLPGGTVFRALAGFGKHGDFHEAHFFEMASEVPIKITFLLTEQQASTFLRLLKIEKLDLFYVKSQVELGRI